MSQRNPQPNQMPTDAPQTTDERMPRNQAGNGQQQSGPFGEPGHRARMLENYNYNLMEELTNLLQSSWRMDTYLKDAGGKCDGCGKLWQDVRKQQELLIEKVRQELVDHAKSGIFT